MTHLKYILATLLFSAVVSAQADASDIEGHTTQMIRLQCGTTDRSNRCVSNLQALIQNAYATGQAEGSCTMYSTTIGKDAYYHKQCIENSDFTEINDVKNWSK